MITQLGMQALQAFTNMDELLVPNISEIFASFYN
jgi:hypothetical protein